MVYILETITLIKYVILIAGIIGVVILLFGASKGQRETFRGGIYIIIATIVIYLCGHFVLKINSERSYDYYPQTEYFQETQNQDTY